MSVGGVETVRDRLASAPGIDFGAAILVFLAVDAVVVTALCAALAPRALLVAVPGAIVTPFVLGWGLNTIGWAPWARRFPARPQRADAVVKKNESFAFGRFVRFNNAVHIAADADHLHLIPCLLLRLGGARVISVPWPRITDAEASARAGLVRAKIDGRETAGPEWCMRLAQPAARAKP